MKYQSEWFKFEDDSLFEKQHHMPMEEEFTFYKSVASGDIKTVKMVCSRHDFANMKEKGTLSENPLQSFKYHCVINIAMCSRFCVEMGMSMEESYKLSDYYIQRADNCKTKEEVVRIQEEMCIDYCERMKSNLSRGNMPGILSKCMEYIYMNITKRITTSDLAKVSGLSESYLTQLFKKETGYSIGNYVRMKKIEHAKKLLKFTDYMISDIADMLSFYSQSHFIHVFKSITGTTPKKYRDTLYCKHEDYPSMADEEILRTAAQKR